jgi:hypothetical protein
MNGSKSTSRSARTLLPRNDNPAWSSTIAVVTDNIVISIDFDVPAGMAT